ncbi:MAG: flagellar protein FlgN [Lachnospiraceae bacterium]|nr:flagellar protein FlgN [Lachnospiraceae bacterium]
MASIIDELAEVLDQENSEYTTLIDLSQQKTSIIIKNDIIALQKIMEEEQVIVDRINVLEKKREGIVREICKVLKIERPADLTVKTLIELLHRQPKEQAQLSEVHNRLRRTLNQMVTVNENNKALIQEALEMIEFEMNLVKGLRMAPETNNYDRSAASGSAVGSSMNGSFDAKQ